MKKLLLFLFSAFAFAACEQAPIEEAHGVADSNRILSVSFEGDDTRIQLQNGKTVWTKGDHVSVFYRSTVNEEWQFMGETGDRTGQIVPVDNSVNPPATHNHVVVAYPYSADYFYNTETHNVEASLPAVQSYLKDSYGTNGNIMISSSEFNKVSLKSVCGWLKLQLTGDGEVVKSVTLRGNDGEQVAGLIYVDSATATATLASASGEAGDGEVGGTLVRPGTILTEVTLDCGEGVTLGKNATAFYIALPPQTFEQGFTVEIEDTEGYVMEQSTDKTLLIERNTIKPMAAFEFINPATPSAPAPASNEIWYTATEKADPYFDDFLTFGADVVSNVWDSETKRGIITFDGDVTMIGEDAFRNCYSLTSVNIPDSVTTIGNSAFYYCCNLTSVNIPDSVTTIGNSAFYFCSSLTSVTIGDSVTEIGDNVFEDCYSLTSVTIGDSVTTIGEYAFWDCDSLTSVTIGDSVTTIGEWAFYECYRLTSVNIPDSVTTIGGGAFSNCDSLTSVNIPDSVTTIGNSAFYDCDRLTEFTGKFAEDNGRILVVDGVLIAFAPAGITEYNIPGSVTEIGGGVFHSCTSLTSVNIPDSVTTIGYAAFYNCTSLTSVNIPDSVTTIGDSAFQDCDSLTSVNIPDSVTTIGGSAFYSCDSLKKVYCYATIPPSLGGDYVFDNNASARRIYVYEECVEVYKSAWSSYQDSIYPNGQNCPETTTIQYTTNDRNTVTPSNLPIISNIYEKGVGTLVVVGKIALIPNSAFRDCDSLTSVNIPDSVTTIGDYAFNKCTSLTSVNIPDSVTTIGWRAFNNCDSLTSVNIPDSVTTIGHYAFDDCDSLTSVIIGDSVTTIGYCAFYNCDSLTSVNIGDSVTSIGGAAFNSCNSLTSVYCKATTPPALDGASVFDYNGSGRKIYVPAGSVNAYKSAEYWSEYADAIVDHYFDNSEVVEPEPIPSNNNKIYYTASDVVVPAVDDAFGAAIMSNNFDAATGKGVITFNGNVTKIGDYAFYDCDSLLEITIPESVCSFGGYVFEDCDNLKNVTMLPIVAPVLGNDVFDDDANIAVNVYKECVDAYKATWSDYASLIVGSGNVSGTTTIKYTTTDGQILTIDSLPVMSNTYKSGVGEMVVYGVLTRVNEWLFSFNDQLKSITLPESITSIEYAAFTYSAALEEVTLGSGVTYIGNSAFDGCESLVGLYCKVTTPPALGDGVFDWTPDTLVVYVPTASVNAYKSDADWSEYAYDIVGYNF